MPVSFEDRFLRAMWSYADRLRIANRIAVWQQAAPFIDPEQSWRLWRSIVALHRSETTPERT